MTKTTHSGRWAVGREDAPDQETKNEPKIRLTCLESHAAFLNVSEQPAQWAGDAGQWAEKTPPFSGHRPRPMPFPTSKQYTENEPSTSLTFFESAQYAGPRQPPSSKENGKPALALPSNKETENEHRTGLTHLKSDAVRKMAVVSGKEGARHRLPTAHCSKPPACLRQPTSPSRPGLCRQHLVSK